MAARAPGLKPQVYFAVSAQKFVILSIATFGFYPIYWSYQNWKRIRDAGEHVSPFWRASLAPFCGVGLMARIKQRAEKEPIAVTWNPTLLGIAFFAVSMTVFLPSPWSLLSVGMFVPLLPAVETCNAIALAAGNPEGKNVTYGNANAAAIIVGGLVWVLVLFGLMLQRSAIP